jgi:hypothetical protein
MFLFLLNAVDRLSPNAVLGNRVHWHSALETQRKASFSRGLLILIMLWTYLHVSYLDSSKPHTTYSHSNLAKWIHSQDLTDHVTDHHTLDQWPAVVMRRSLYILLYRVSHKVWLLGLLRVRASAKRISMHSQSPKSIVSQSVNV